MKNLLFVSRHAPYGTGIAREALDALLGASAYGQNLSLLFMDDGVFQLLNAQNPSKLNQKNLSANLPALPLYDVENIFVHSESLRARALHADDLVLEPKLFKVISSQEVAELMNQQDQLLSF
ncbi:sulfurtransferase complex subunit TusC [Marinimicrobium sp. ABcell2]|uniref:sulfurtransferase complex subunit TusC n=1 Tax=Marinimicrobium sp. ABcell2 TaxID=3069751 RepID=UPI0027B747FC|nr:sulfurtransferase complex subunit TusC [Marinimicrobium sp. ABcell2]MDQ2075664.1 sulfurtransferase complex subunit TusC [Marinimicrobium sp. ABcell2]